MPKAPHFVCLILTVLATSLALPAQKNSPVSDTGFVLDAGDHDLMELTERAAEFLGRNILIGNTGFGARAGRRGNQQPAPDDPMVSIQRKLVLDVLGCEEVLSQLLFSQGYCLVPLDEKRGIWEVLHRQGSRSAELHTRALPTTVEEVLRRPGLYIPISTTVAVEHLNANIAINSLRPMLYASGNNSSGGPPVALSSLGNHHVALIGLQPQVAQAIRFLRAADQPQKEFVAMETVNTLTELRMKLANLKATVDWLYDRQRNAIAPKPSDKAGKSASAKKK